MFWNGFLKANPPVSKIAVNIISIDVLYRRAFEKPCFVVDLSQQNLQVLHVLESKVT
jgi:hypothetical protein